MAFVHRDASPIVASRLGDERQRDHDVDEREAERAGGLGVAAADQRLPHRPQPGQRDRERPATARRTSCGRSTGSPPTPGRALRCRRSPPPLSRSSENAKVNSVIAAFARNAVNSHTIPARNHAIVGGDSRHVDATEDPGLDRLEVTVEPVVAERVGVDQGAARHLRCGADVREDVATRRGPLDARAARLPVARAATMIASRARVHDAASAGVVSNAC